MRSSEVGDGFGGKLVQRSVRGQLAGSIEYDWDAAALIVTLRMKSSRLANGRVGSFFGRDETAASSINGRLVLDN